MQNESTTQINENTLSSNKQTPTSKDKEEKNIIQTHIKTISEIDKTDTNKEENEKTKLPFDLITKAILKIRIMKTSYDSILESIQNNEKAFEFIGDDKQEISKVKEKVDTTNNAFIALLKQFKIESKKILAEQEKNIQILKKEEKEKDSLLQELREKEQKLINRNSNLEKKQEELSQEIKRLNEDIATKGNIISSLQDNNLKKDDLIELLNNEKARDTLEFKNKLASSLRLDYQEFIESQTVEMSEEVGEILKIKLQNIFDTLKKNGVNL